MYPQQSSTPSTVRSDSRVQVDSPTANMAMTPSCQGMLTDEQEKARDLRLALFGDNYLIAKQQSKFDSQMRSTSTAMTARSVERSGHLVMTATIVQDKHCVGRAKCQISLERDIY